jgi:N-acyl-D-amino-acid deacylase
LACFFCALGACAEPTSPETPPADTPILRAGPQDAAYGALDDLMAELMIRWTIPGCAVAVVKAGTMVHWQGFGYADRERKIPVERDTLFRVASVSKPITAVAVLRMVERGKFALDTPLGELLPEDVRDASDPNIARVTVRQLLQHSAGWDDGDHDEVALRNDVRRLARLAGPGGSVTPADIVRHRFKRPLDFMPGTDHAYSNFGYVVLGRIIERATGKPYPDAVREIAFTAPGTDCTAIIGAAGLNELDPREARYYDFPGAQPVEAVLSPGKATAWPDGGIATTQLDSALGWVTSAPSLALFTDRTFAALHGRSGLLTEKTVREVIARPAPPLWVGAEAYYGLGWRVRPLPEGPCIWHGGSMPGTSALVVHDPGDVSIAVVMNSRPRDWDEFSRHLRQGVERMAGNR